MFLNFILIILNASINDKPSHKKRTGKIKNTNPPKNMFTDRGNDQFFEGKEWDDIPEKRKKLGPLDCRICKFPLVEDDEAPTTPNPPMEIECFSRQPITAKNAKRYKCVTKNCGKSQRFIGPPPATKDKFKIIVNRSKFFEKREKRKQAVLNGEPLEKQKEKPFVPKKRQKVVYSVTEEVVYYDYHKPTKKAKKE